MQLLSLFFLFITGCTTGVSADRAGDLPDGLYHFTAKPAVPPQFAQVAWTPGGWKVNLLGDTGGSFVLKPDDQGAVQITGADMSYPGLKRTMKGMGQLEPDALASGNLELWLGGKATIKRNHRKAEWTLRPATPREQRNWTRKQRLLEERKKRAQEAGLDLKEP